MASQIMVELEHKQVDAALEVLGREQLDWQQQALLELLRTNSFQRLAVTTQVHVLILYGAWLAQHAGTAAAVDVLHAVKASLHSGSGQLAPLPRALLLSILDHQDSVADAYFEAIDPCAALPDDRPPQDDDDADVVRRWAGDQASAGQCATVPDAVEQALLRIAAARGEHCPLWPELSSLLSGPCFVALVRSAVGSSHQRWRECVACILCPYVMRPDFQAAAGEVNELKQFALAYPQLLLSQVIFPAFQQTHLSEAHSRALVACFDDLAPEHMARVSQAMCQSSLQSKGHTDVALDVVQRPAARCDAGALTAMLEASVSHAGRAGVSLGLIEVVRVMTCEPGLSLTQQALERLLAVLQSLPSHLRRDAVMRKLRNLR